MPPSQKRTTAIAGSWSYCSKNIHCRTCARSYRSSGPNRVPSPRYHVLTIAIRPLRRRRRSSARELSSHFSISLARCVAGTSPIG
jgi:hypothetical protein